MLYGADVLIDGSSSVTGKGGKVAINPGKAQARKVDIEPYEEIMRFNQRVVIQDQETGYLHINTPYKVVLEDGTEITGVTNNRGETDWINSQDLEQSFDIYLGVE